MECVESGRRREDVAPVHWRVHQAGLHRWRPGLSTALQRPVRPDDIVRAAQAVDVPVELVGATGVAGRATAHVRRALANREVETLDERGVQGLGILRLPQRSLQPTRRADPPAPFDSDDAIVPPSLEHWTIDARRPQEALNHPNVLLEPIGRDQRESHHASAEDDVVEDGRGVSRGAAAEHAPGPQSGTHLDGRTQPCGSALVADERAELISLQLNDFEVAQHPLVEALRRSGRVDIGTGTAASNREVFGSLLEPRRADPFYHPPRLAGRLRAGRSATETLSLVPGDREGATAARSARGAPAPPSPDTRRCPRRSAWRLGIEPERARSRR